jgi:hypothetical protein
LTKRLFQLLAKLTVGTKQDDGNEECQEGRKNKQSMRGKWGR